MKVICIDDHSHSNQRVTKIPFGEVVTVIDSEMKDSASKGRVLCYNILEYKISLVGTLAWYWAGQFAPLNGPDENEILEQRMEALDAECTALFQGIPEPSEAHVAMMWKDMERRIDELENPLT